MRELKFRAWNKENGQYVPPMTIQEMIHQKENEFNLEQLNEWFVFEQYTGFKDEKDNEIYEGDVIMCNPMSFKNDVESTLRYVRHDGTGE